MWYQTELKCAIKLFLFLKHFSSSAAGWWLLQVDCPCVCQFVADISEPCYWLTWFSLALLQGLSLNRISSHSKPLLLLKPGWCQDVNGSVYSIVTGPSKVLVPHIMKEMGIALFILASNFLSFLWFTNILALFQILKMWETESLSQGSLYELSQSQSQSDSSTDEVYN